MRGILLENREKLVTILREITSSPLVSPGDVVVRTRLPRYEVLAAFHVLEALGVIEEVYSKGNHKLYSPRPIAKQLLEVLEEGVSDPLEELAKRMVGASTSIPTAHEHAVAEA